METNDKKATSLRGKRRETEGSDRDGGGAEGGVRKAWRTRRTS